MEHGEGRQSECEDGFHDVSSPEEGGCGGEVCGKFGEPPQRGFVRRLAADEIVRTAS